MVSSAKHALPALAPLSMAQLMAGARRLGVPPQDYVALLVEDCLAIERAAAASSFDKIMKPVRRSSRRPSEAEVVEMVERARAEHHGRGGGSRKR